MRYRIRYHVVELCGERSAVLVWLLVRQVVAGRPQRDAGF